MAKGATATAEVSEKSSTKQSDSHLQGVRHEVSQHLQSKGNIKAGEHPAQQTTLQLFGKVIIDGLHNAETGIAKATEQVTGGRITAKQVQGAETATENLVHNSADFAGAAIKGAGNELSKETKPVVEWVGKHPAESVLIGTAVIAGAFALPEMVAGSALANGLGQLALAARVGTGIVTAVESSKGAMELYENHGAQILFNQQDKHYSAKTVEQARKHVSEAMGKPVLGMAAFGLESGLESAAKGAERFTEAKELGEKLKELSKAEKHSHDLSNGLKAAEGVAAGLVAGAAKSEDFQAFGKFMEDSIAKFPALETFFKPVDAMHKAHEFTPGLDETAVHEGSKHQ
jgi:hypothetical protein